MRILPFFILIESFGIALNSEASASCVSNDLEEFCTVGTRLLEALAEGCKEHPYEEVLIKTCQDDFNGELDHSHKYLLRNALRVFDKARKVEILEEIVKSYREVCARAANQKKEQTKGEVQKRAQYALGMYFLYVHPELPKAAYYAKKASLNGVPEAFDLIQTIQDRGSVLAQKAKMAVLESVEGEMKATSFEEKNLFPISLIPLIED